jgi:hypothetical protein
MLRDIASSRRDGPSPAKHVADPGDAPLRVGEHMIFEEGWPHIEATEPELLAYHYTEAKQPEKAIPLWRKAGSPALKRMALAEAVAHLNKGLDLVAALPPSAERDGEDLDLRTLLGTAWMAPKGWAAQEVWDGLHPALGLANSLRRNDALVPILWGLFIHVLSTAVGPGIEWLTATAFGATAAPGTVVAAAPAPEKIRARRRHTRSLPCKARRGAYPGTWATPCVKPPAAFRAMSPPNLWSDPY